MRKKIVLISVIVIILVPILLYSALRSSYVQNYLIQRIATYFSDELQTEVKVGGVDITYFLNIVLEDVSIKDQNNQQLLSVDKLIFDISRISFNNKFLFINKLSFDNANLAILKYPESENYNFQFLIDYFSSEPKEKKDQEKWGFACSSFEFKNSEFKMQDLNQAHNGNLFDPNYIALSDFNLKINDVFLEKDTLTATFKHMSFYESCGIRINDFSGDISLSNAGSYIRNMVLKTNHSIINLDATIDYNSLDDFENFTQNVSIVLDIEPSSFGFSDLGIFFEDFSGKEDKFYFNGNFSGRLSNLRARDFLFGFGNSTILDGNFFITGLPDYDNTFLSLSVDEFRTTRKDLDRFANVVNIEFVDNQIYNQLANLGNVHFTGNLTGFLNDFVAYGDLQTDIGVLKSDIAIYDEGSNGKIGYKGSLAADNFNIGKFLNQENSLGKISLDFIVEGTGTSFESANIELKGKIDKANFNNYNYQNIELAGNLVNKRFNGAFVIDDPNILLDFAGIVDFYESPYHFDFFAKVDNANLTRLNIFQRDSLFESVISTDLSLNVKASNIDDLVGETYINYTNYKEIFIEDGTINKYDFDKIIVSNFLDKNGRKNLNINSDIADLNISGDIVFEELEKSLNSFFASVMPAWFDNKDDITIQEQTGMEFNYMVELKNTSNITELFFPGLSIADGAIISGYYTNNSKQLNIDGKIPKITFNNNSVYDFEISGGLENGKYVLETNSSKLMLSDSLWMDNLTLRNHFNNDTLLTLLKWKNDDSKIRNEGWIESTTNFHNQDKFDIKFLPSHFFINDSLWKINLDHFIQIDSGFYNIDNFMIYKNQEHLIVDGIVSKNPDDEIKLQFEGFDISNFDWFFEKSNLKFDGILSGNVALSNLSGTPNFLCDAEIVNFAFNDDHLGNLLLTTHYDHDEERFDVQMEVIYFGNIGYNKPIVGSGYYYPDRDDNNFDLDFYIENLKMSIFGRYLEGFAKNFRGMASGKLRLEGPANSPELSGNVRLARTGFRIDYLNTSYTFAHDVRFEKNYFAFENMIINDTIGNRARATGYIYHDDFRDFSLDIEILPENLVLLNTSQAQNELYYGSAFATGRAHIHGPVDDIVMDITARTNRGTQIFLPLMARGELSESTFITFVSRSAESNDENPFIPHTIISGLELNFDLEITPDAEVQIIFDSQVGDIIRGRGYGNLSMDISSQGAFNMYGEYTLEEGDYLFTLQNMINKRFQIEKGGNIRWSGDPFDADIDLKALYSVRTALYDLVMEIDTSHVYRRRVPVDVVLKMQDELFNPDITFDINLPQSDEATREMVDGLITTEQEMNRQIFSLLVLSRFLPKDPSYDTALGYGVGMTSTEMLSNQISNWLSQISNDFDIGVNYRPGDEISSQELEVALSTQLFDDRLIIDGNVGVAGDHPAAEQQASNIIGDVNIEYKITPEGRFRVKAFNRSNALDVLQTNTLYTQGIGVFYRKEFDRFDELLRRRKKEMDENPELEE